MNNEKIMRARTTMQILLNAQIVRQIDELIIGTAAQMDIAYGIKPPEKSKTSHNCCDDCEFGILQKENAELKKQFEELRLEVGASLELINHIVQYTHRILAEENAPLGRKENHNE